MSQTPPGELKILQSSISHIVKQEGYKSSWALILPQIVYSEKAAKGSTEACAVPRSYWAPEMWLVWTWCSNKASQPLFFKKCTISHEEFDVHITLKQLNVTRISLVLTLFKMRLPEALRLLSVNITDSTHIPDASREPQGKNTEYHCQDTESLRQSCPTPHCEPAAAVLDFPRLTWRLNAQRIAPGGDNSKTGKEARASHLQARTRACTSQESKNQTWSKRQDRRSP